MINRISRFTALPGGPEVTMTATIAGGINVACEGRHPFIVQPDQELKVARQIVTGSDPARMTRAQLERMAAAYIAEVDGRAAYADRLDTMLNPPLAGDNDRHETFDPCGWENTPVAVEIMD